MKRFSLCAAAFLGSIPAVALAHHGWSSYDSETVLKLRGTFQSVSWENPHATARTTWEGREWMVILAPVSRMETRGLTPAMIAPGQQIRIVGYPRKDGTPEMRLERVIVGDTTVELR